MQGAANSVTLKLGVHKQSPYRPALAIHGGETHYADITFGNGGFPGGGGGGGDTVPSNYPDRGLGAGGMIVIHY